LPVRSVPGAWRRTDGAVQALELVQNLWASTCLLLHPSFGGNLTGILFASPATLQAPYRIRLRRMLLIWRELQIDREELDQPFLLSDLLSEFSPPIAISYIREIS
jgi:hypothetical protein